MTKLIAKSTTKNYVTKKRLLIIGGVLLLLLAVSITFVFWLYSKPITSKKINIFKKYNAPIAKVGSGFVKGQEQFSRYDIALQLYSKNADFKAEKTQNDILDRLIEIKKLETVASSRGLQITKAETQTEYDRMATLEGGAEQLEKILSEKYFFTPDQFKEKSLAPDLLKTKLAISFYNDKALNPELYKTLDTINLKLAEKTDFSVIAKTYSEDPSTRQFGGDSGEIPIFNLAPELQAVLKDAQPEQTHTITTRFGIYLIKVINVKDDSEIEGGSIHFQSILLSYGKIDSKVVESAFTKWYNSPVNNIQSKKYIKF